MVRLAEPLARKCKAIAVCKKRMVLMSSLVVLEVLVVGEQEDHVAFCEEICLEWDHIYNPVCTQHYTLQSQANLPNHRRP